MLVMSLTDKRENSGDVSSLPSRGAREQIGFFIAARIRTRAALAANGWMW
jgi:hypothetical protein